MDKRSYVADLGEAFVKVTGERSNKFVEFEFSLNLDEDLCVELILPFDEFKAFCAKHDVTFIDNTDTNNGGNGRPGLYRSPSNSSDNDG